MNNQDLKINNPDLASDLSLLQTAINCQKSSQPQAEAVVNALVNLEKAGKKAQRTVSYQELVGKWRLWFITGTKKTRQRAGIMLGAGRYIPQWINIGLSYSRNPEVTLNNAEAGNVENSVSLGGLNLTLTGPTKFFQKQKLLAFDFTQMTIRLFGKVIYSGNIRQGKQSTDTFYEEPIKKQAFFRYFHIGEDCIAARGRGGGLALWRREG
jgi:hypothetical protein